MELDNFVLVLILLIECNKAGQDYPSNLVEKETKITFKAPWIQGVQSYSIITLTCASPSTMAPPAIAPRLFLKPLMTACTHPCKPTHGTQCLLILGHCSLLDRVHLRCYNSWQNYTAFRSDPSCNRTLGSYRGLTSSCSLKSH